MYSRIKYVEVFNFMCFDHAEMYFDDSNVVSLKGYNNSGKSAFLKAIMVCLANMFATKQNKLIRYGAEYFRIVVGFDDGVRILRDKYITGQSLYEMYKGDECIFTTKQGTKLTKVDSVPEVIEQYVGLCTLDLGCLNYQSRDDRLWLIETTGGENYYSLSEILKIEEIARANALLNSDKNELNSSIAGLESDINACEQVLASFDGTSEELLSLLSEREVYTNGLREKYTMLRDLVEVCDDLASVRDVPCMDAMGCGFLDVLVECVEVSGSVSGLCRVPEVSFVNNNSIDVLENIKAVSDRVRSLKVFDEVGLIPLKSIVTLLDALCHANKMSDLGIYDSVDSIDGSTLEDMSNLLDCINQFERLEKSISDMEEVLESYNSECQGVSNILRGQGIVLQRCESCGNYVKVGV